MSRPRGNVRYDNTGRTVVVTGGQQGIGLAICEEFASTGATVFSLDIASGSSHHHTTSSSKAIEHHHLDVSNLERGKMLIDEIARRSGGIDVLVNNAAIQPPQSYRPIDEYSDALWQRMLEVNLTGYTYMAKHVLPLMRQQGSGVIVNIASAQGHRTTRGVPAYGPIKAANIMQARQWGVEFARDGIRVVSVSPGAIDTPLVRSTLAEQGGFASLANRHPMGRLGTTSEIARAVVWLASEDASFVTATDLEVDGGLGAFGAFADPFPLKETDEKESPGESTVM